MEAEVLREASGRLRQGVRDLRTLLVEIHPPNLESAGLQVALSDLLSPLEAAGIQTELNVEEVPGAGVDHGALIYRVAREAVRNAHVHGAPRRVRIEVTRPSADMTRLIVNDDGKGFDPAAREQREAQGHLGLTLLEALVAQADGTLSVTSQPGNGTTVTLEVPTR